MRAIINLPPALLHQLLHCCWTQLPGPRHVRWAVGIGIKQSRQLFYDVLCKAGMQGRG